MHESIEHTKKGPLHKPSGPIRFPKLRIRIKFAGVPHLLCSMGQKPLTLETGRGYGYEQGRESIFPTLCGDSWERTGHLGRQGALPAVKPFLQAV